MGLIGCWRRAARELGIELQVLAVDVDPDLSAACQVADARFSVPVCDDPNYIKTVLDICKSESVDLVIPTIDNELLPLADAAERFAACGTRVHVGPSSVIRAVRDKAQTMDVLGGAGLPVPHTAILEEIRTESYEWRSPLFLKPRSGFSSRGLKLIVSPDDIPKDVSEPMIVQEYLDGPEYTVNVFVDGTGTLRCAVPHERLRVRAGEVEKGITRRDEAIESLAAGIVDVLGIRGVFCFQVIKDKKTGPQIIEINARFGGGYPLADRAGAKFCRWLLEEFTGRPLTANNRWQENVLMLRYDEAIFPGSG